MTTASQTPPAGPGPIEQKPGGSRRPPDKPVSKPLDPKKPSKSTSVRLEIPEDVREWARQLNRTRGFAPPEIRQQLRQTLRRAYAELDQPA